MSQTDAEATESTLFRARHGQAEAVGALLQRYRTYLILLVRSQIGRRLQGKLDADDVLQEVCLEVHRDFHRFRGVTEAELLGWLRQILACTLANQIRRYYGTKQRDPRLERELADDLDHSSRAFDGGLVAAEPSPSENVAARERAILLADALDGLSADYREVLMLRHAEDLTFPEIGRRMERSEDSVKHLWARALARLRRTMEDPR